MLSFLIVLDVIIAVLIIAGVFLHNGPDGFIGDSTPTSVTTGPKFETFDKIIGSLVLAFFAVTLGINYLTLYQYKGTADIDAIIDKTNLEKKIEKIEQETSDIQAEAPLAK